MFKKISFGVLMLLLTLSIVGCAGGDKPAEKVAADKALLTYAELLMFGESTGADALGLTDAEKAEVINFTANDRIEAGKATPISEESAQFMAAKTHEKFKQIMKFTATLKKDDTDHPVVEIKTTALLSSAPYQ